MAMHVVVCTLVGWDVTDGRAGHYTIDAFF